jgi:uncharacterized membrane protein YdbT with pleckstrin-like domain
MIDTESGNRLPLRKTIPLQRRKILKKSLSGVMSALGISFLAGIVLYFVIRFDTDRQIIEDPAIAWVGFAFLVSFLLMSRMVYQWLYYLTYFYDMDEKNFIVRKGVITRKEVTLPFAKITDVYIDQDILDVLFAIYDLNISTPTVESGEFAHIDGLSRKGSTKLKELIIEKMNQSSEPNEVNQKKGG